MCMPGGVVCSVWCVVGKQLTPIIPPVPLTQVADMVVWAGISFQQSASVEYFRRVRHMLGTHGRLNNVPQVRARRPLGRWSAGATARCYGRWVLKEGVCVDTSPN